MASLILHIFFKKHPFSLIITLLSHRIALLRARNEDKKQIYDKTAYVQSQQFSKACLWR